VGDLADGRGGPVDSSGDFVVPQIEYLAQHEHRPLVGLLAPAERTQPIKRMPGDDPYQKGTFLAHGVDVDADPPQPGLLCRTSSASVAEPSIS
jgi:hypothetical protein